MSIKKCKLVTLPKIADERGLLSFVEGKQHIPFEIKRIFYLYNVPKMKTRGAHAHKTLHQFIISFGDGLDIKMDDGHEKQSLQLNKPWQGLYIPPMIWTSVENFCDNSICMVLASDSYDEADYYRNYDAFLRAAGK